MAFPLQQIGHAGEEPERGVRGVTVGVVMAPDHIGQGAVLLIAGEGFEDVPDRGQFSGGGDAAEADQGVPAPIEEPRVAGNHGEGVVAFHNELAHRIQQGEVARSGIRRSRGHEGGEAARAVKGGGQHHGRGGGERQGEVTGTEQIRVFAKAPRGIDGMLHGEAFRFPDETGAGDGNLELPLLAGHGETVRPDGQSLLQNRYLVHREVPFFMETAVLHVRAQNQGDRAGFIAGGAFKGNADGILTGGQVHGGGELDPVAVPAGQAEGPEGGLAGNEAHLFRPERADFRGKPAPHQPGPATGQDHAAVHREIRMRIGGEQGVILGAHGAPGGPQVGHGAGAIGEDEVQVRFVPDLRAGGGGRGIGQGRGQHQRDGASLAGQAQQYRGGTGAVVRPWHETEMPCRAGQAVAFRPGLAPGLHRITERLRSGQEQQIAGEPDHFPPLVAGPGDHRDRGEGQAGEGLAESRRMAGQDGGGGPSPAGGHLQPDGHLLGERGGLLHNDGGNRGMGQGRCGEHCHGAGSQPGITSAIPPAQRSRRRAAGHGHEGTRGEIRRRPGHLGGMGGFQIHQNEQGLRFIQGDAPQSHAGAAAAGDELQGGPGGKGGLFQELLERGDGGRLIFCGAFREGGGTVHPDLFGGEPLGPAGEAPTAGRAG